MVVFLELSDERFDPGGVLVRLEVRGEAPPDESDDTPRMTGSVAEGMLVD